MKALLLSGKRCPYCHTMEKMLNDLLASNDLSELEVLLIEEQPEFAEALGVRSVPWLRLGDHVEIIGAHTLQEIKDLIELAKKPLGVASYYGQLFQSGQLNQVIKAVRLQPERIHEVLKLLFVERTKMVERIGISALLEDLQGEAILKAAMPELEKLSQAKDHKDRVDAAYYLSLVASPQARDLLKKLLNDSHEEVVAEAEDALA